jgi:hypothetical protein
MAVGDQAGPAPKKGLPLWVIIGGGVGIGLFLYVRRKGAAGGGGPAPALVPGVVTDPNTGLPIDPLTGLPYLANPASPPTNESWFNGAAAWASHNGISPSLANQSLYDYINGQILNPNESSVIDKILGGYGYPPTPLPFGGNPVLPTPTPSPPVQTTKAYITTSKIGGPARQFGIPTQADVSSGRWQQQVMATLAKYGLATRASNGQYYTTKKFTGNVRPLGYGSVFAFQPIVDSLVKYGVLTPVNVHQPAPA